MACKALAFAACLASCAELGAAKNFATTKIYVPGIGNVLGNVLNDGTVEALGIPFAAPPVGANRFRPPQAAVYDDNDINATAYGDACLQTSQTGDVGSMSEDCLNLNIWAPHSQDKQLLPVYFWIHGGAFVEGSGKLYNGSHLASLGIVVVTINYRLGGFGWFSSDEVARENPQNPGNGAVHGFLDQNFALRWVHKYIAAFGGDASKITIGGESAGSMSTCAHMHLPISKDLFRAAIMESGSCTSGAPWVAFWSSSSSQNASRALLAAVNASDLTSLRKVAADTILKAPTFAQINPAIDGWYMPKSTADLPVATKGVKMIIGANTMDTLQAPPYIGLSPEDFTPKDVVSYEQRLMSYFGKDVFTIYPHMPADTRASDVAKSFYRVGADVCNTCPKHWAAQKFLAANETVFVYEFGYASGSFSGLACHGCEVEDAFGFSMDSKSPVDNFLKNSYTPELASTMSQYWASFVRTLQPTGKVPWNLYRGGVSTAEQLRIVTTEEGQPALTVASGRDASKCEFFQNFIHASGANNDAYVTFCNSPAPRTAVHTEQALVV